MGRPRHGRRRRVPVVAPSVLSLIRNPVETIAFIAALRSAFQRRSDVFVDLSAVTELTSDAVLVMISKFEDQRFVNGMRVGGSEPLADRPRQMLHQAGFFQTVRSVQFKEPPEHGRIRRKRNFIVEPEIAQELIEFATERMVGGAQDKPGVYLALLESMANTHEHAARETKAMESWWANVYAPPGNKRSFFTFVDNGVGIFRSVTVRRIRRSIGMTDNVGLLKDWFAGKITVPSRTGERTRGKGLRAIHREFQRRRLTNLVIIANDVYANVAENRYELLPNPFHGTFLYWELEA